MHIHVFDTVRLLIGVGLGGLIGYAFGLLHSAAQRRHEKQLANGQYKGGWGLLPGSFGRVAYLFIILLLVQIFCPVLFFDGVQWWVSAGVVCGYACMLLRQYLQLRKAGGKA